MVVGANTGYGLIKQRHMFQYGTTQEQFAKCAADERFNAAANPNAVWYQKPVTVEDVLNSRFTNDPLHLLELVMPCSGAAAIVVTTAERARALPNRPAFILGTGGPASRHWGYFNQGDDITVTPVVQSAPVALQMAQYNVTDMQFAEFYDCYTILVMECLEDAGFTKKGEIGPFYQATDTTFKGSFPINTDGGQIGGGQPGFGGGFRHVVEAARQIMGRAGERQVAKNDLCLVNG
jgi:acetyl-CoA acetyltransferase